MFPDIFAKVSGHSNVLQSTQPSRLFRILAVKTEVVVVDEGHVILVDHEEALHLCVCVCIYLPTAKHEVDGGKDQQKKRHTFHSISLSTAFP